jgi:hypothetical protein
MAEGQISGTEMEFFTEIYSWVDQFDFSKPKRNIVRDFADGVFVAEIIHEYRPDLVKLHNFTFSSSLDKKRYNWTFLRNKVLKKIGVKLEDEEIENIINAKLHAIDYFLARLRKVLDNLKSKKEVLPYEDKVVKSNLQELQELKKQAGAEQLKKALFQEGIVEEPENNDEVLEKVLSMKERIDTLYNRILSLEEISTGKDRKIEDLENLILKHKLI